MGRRKSWFLSVKKALSPDSEEKKAKKTLKSKKKWFRKKKPSISDSPNHEIVEVVNGDQPLPPLEDGRPSGVELELTEHDQTVVINTETDGEADIGGEMVDVKVVQPCREPRFSEMAEDEVAAIKIQTAFRGYLARRALRALKGLARLKSLVDGPAARRQTANTMKCMQALSRVQSQIQSRRIMMLEENRALQRQILQKRAKELETLRMGDEWDDSLHSKQQIEASMLHKYEATMRRERALAYSYTHQQMWKKTAKSTNLLYMDPTNPQWGWSWLERWMAAQTTEAHSASEKDGKSDHLSVKSVGLGNVGEITKSFARHQLNSKTSPANKKPPFSTSPLSKTVSASADGRKWSPSSPKVTALNQDDDFKERNRRHSIGATLSLVRDDDESLASSSLVPSYMVSTKSTKAKSRLSSPLGIENSETPEKGSGTAKKRLPYPAKPRRHSGPPKVDTSSIINDNGNGILD